MSGEPPRMPSIRTDRDTQAPAPARRGSARASRADARERGTAPSARDVSERGRRAGCDPPKQPGGVPLPILPPRLDSAARRKHTPSGTPLEDRFEIATDTEPV